MKMNKLTDNQTKSTHLIANKGKFALMFDRFSHELLIVGSAAALIKIIILHPASQEMERI